MRVFIDTSAFYALLDRTDEHHLKAGREWNRILDVNYTLVTSNYILVETLALVQGRLGMEAVRRFQEDIFPSFPWSLLPLKCIVWQRQPCFLHPEGV